MPRVGCLYIVATPIGNMADITLRALEILKSVDVIAAEDTRHSRHLLTHYAIDTPMISLHEHNEQQRTEKMLERLAKGEQVALISDAGTPLVSDPGYRLVQAVHAAKLQVVPIPGACAAIAGLVASGLPTEQFIFIGFLPAKGAARKRALDNVIHETRTLIIYESVHRIENLFELLLETFGEQRRATIARELTKTFETIKQASLIELRDWLTNDSNQRKGEFVVIVEGSESVDIDVEEQKRIISILLAELPLKQAVALTTQITGGSRKPIYQLALSMQGQGEHDA